MKSLLKSAVAGAALMAASFAAHAADINIVVVSHGQASDPFWSVVKNGVAEAAKDTGVKVDYRAPETFDMVQMGQLIDAAINQKPQGIVVSIPDADALGPSIQRAVAAGIPVISMNSGSDASKKLGALLHVGQDEFDAGKVAVRRLVVTHAVRDREPIAPAELVTGTPVLAFVELSNADAIERDVVVTFEREGRPAVGHVKLHVPASSPRFRTWARTHNLSEVGTWEAVVRGEDGKELGRQPFELVAMLDPA